MTPANLPSEIADQATVRPLIEANKCTFSPDRRHRYSLRHDMNTLAKSPRVVAWIGLNPSTADENVLDPTLRRVRAFSLAAGFDSFVMLNLFSYRATDPEELMTAKWGLDETIANSTAIAAERCPIVFAWGATHHQWDQKKHQVAVWCGLRRDALCLGTTKGGHPRHPLYVSGATRLEGFGK